jgi:hypothetical protein
MKLDAFERLQQKARGISERREGRQAAKDQCEERAKTACPPWSLLRWPIAYPEKDARKAALLDAIRLYGKRPLNELEAHLGCESGLIPGAFVAD